MLNSGQSITIIVMVEKIIDEIRKAETEAAQIIKQAEKTVKSIEQKTLEEIEELRTAAEVSLNSQIAAQQAQIAPANGGQAVVVVDKAKSDAAKKFILEQFNKRFA